VSFPKAHEFLGTRDKKERSCFAGEEEEEEEEEEEGVASRELAKE
jgi:hypothetical protein